MINEYALIMISSAFLASVSQMLLKLSANKHYKHIIFDYLNPYVISGYGLLMLTMVMNIFAYKGLDYKMGPILASFSYLFVMILGRFVLKEEITKNKLLGVIIIIIGISVFNL